MQSAAFGEFPPVVAGLDPAIHGAERACRASQGSRTSLLKSDWSWRWAGSSAEDAGDRVDGRVKPGHDGNPQGHRAMTLRCGVKR